MKRFWLFGLFLAGTLVALNAPAFAKESTDSQDTQDMTDAMDDVNSALGSMASRVSTIEDQLKLKFFGDVRLRFAFLGQSQSDVVTPATTIQAQELARYRVRFGAMKQFGDFNAAFRLATGSDSNPLSENQTDGLFNADKWFGLDQAYLTYTPSAMNGHFKATAGKMPNPLTNTPISWDPDPQPEGLLLEGSMDDAKVRATYFVLQDNSGVAGLTNINYYMAWFQAEQNFKIDTDTSALLTVGYEYVPYMNAMQTGVGGPSTIVAPSSPTGGAFKTPEQLGMYNKPGQNLPDVQTVEAILGVKNKIAGVPFKWTLHVMDNLNSSDLSPGYTDQYAAYFGINIGDASDKDTWAGLLAAGYIEPNATFSEITDDDSGDNNTEYLRGNLTYGIDKGIQLSWTSWAIDHVYYSTGTTGGGATSNGLGKTSRDPEIKSYLDLLATF